jgi:hypothetical protein
MDPRRKIIYDRANNRRKLLRDKFQSMNFRDGPVFLNSSYNQPLLVLEGGGRDFSIQAYRLAVADAQCTRDEFDELYSSSSDFELKYDWCSNLSLVDLLAMINIHVSVRYSPMPSENRDWFNLVHETNEYPPFPPRRLADVQQTYYTSEQIQSILSWGLFWGDSITNFHVNYRDGNDKYLTAESKTHFYVLFMGTS